MDLTPWKPFRELSTFRKEMDNLFKRFFGEAQPFGPLAEGWAPSVDVSESEDKLLVKVELPGLEAKDVEVNLSGDLLTIKGEKKTEQERKEEKYHYSERYYGSFERSFRLPVPVQTDKIEADFEKGVLTISLPKVEEAKTKSIKIDVK
jgi:HSP20 family protein